MTAAQDRQVLITASAGAAIMLIAAVIGDWPYGFFTLLRWVVCAAAILVGIRAYGWQRIWAVPIFALIAILFNPLVPVYLSRSTWQPIDMLSAVLFLLAAIVVKSPSASGGGVIK